jgi:CheY-like chemotaxis protein
MNLTPRQNLLKTGKRALTLDQRAELAASESRRLEKAGEYETAREQLQEFWPGDAKSVNLTSLTPANKAEILLRIGAVTAWLGSVQKLDGGQERAKDLITQSIEIFQELGQSSRVAEANSDLALCYWREGAFDDARVILGQALASLPGSEHDLRAVLLIRAGMVEMDSLRLNDAFRFFHQAEPLVGESQNDALKGSFHMEFALLLRRLAAAENHEAYIDQALIENAAASFYHERSGNTRYLARVENNLGNLFFTIGRNQDAHHHLDRARHLFFELQDEGTIAQVDETRARVFLAEGRLKEAERIIRWSVKTLEKGGEQALLAEALTTQAVIQARIRNYSRSKVLLQRATEIAQTAGDLAGAGKAQLSMIEELSGQTPALELAAIFESAAELLDRSQDPSTNQRLIAAARKLFALMTAEHNRGLKIEPVAWEGFSLRREIKRIEKVVIEQALRDAGGSVSKAAHLLGFKHHQSLIALIQGRHSDLQEQRSVVRRRRRHLVSKRSPASLAAARVPTSGKVITVLHVEDNRAVARVVRDQLIAARMHVESCVNGLTALEILKTPARYDVLVVDDNLPGLSGLELVLRVRSIAHRSTLPIVMLSGADCEKEAWRAGVDAFLLKPKTVEQLATTISRVMNHHEKTPARARDNH